MKEYCIPDMKLLKAGCMKFQSEFESHADFRPMEKWVTIALACNRFWRKKLLPRNTITVEPPRSWHSARTTTFLKARQWLAWQEHLLRVSTSTTSRANELQADRIRHSCNGEEVQVITPAQSYLVDGYDSTQTVYEFHGCLWHKWLRVIPASSSMALSLTNTWSTPRLTNLTLTDILQH